LSKFLKTTLAAVTVLALPAQAVAQSASPQCLAPGEVRALTTFAMPSILTGLITNCGPTLGTSSFMATPIILTPENLASRSLGAALAEGVVAQTASGATPLDGFLIMMHSASSRRAAEIARVEIEQHYHRQLSRALGGALAQERAAIILAIVAGIQAMRQVIGLSALAKARPARLAAILTPVFDQLVAGPLPAARRRRHSAKTG